MVLAAKPDSSGELLQSQQVSPNMRNVPLVKALLGGKTGTTTITGTSYTAIFRSELLPADKLSLGLNFIGHIGGLLDGDAAETAEVKLNAVEPDGTTVTLATLTTGTLANETEGFVIDFMGRVALEQDGVTSGKIFGLLRWHFGSTSAGDDIECEASVAAGIATDLRNGIYFEVTAKFSAGSAVQMDAVCGGMFVNNAGGFNEG